MTVFSEYFNRKEVDKVTNALEQRIKQSSRKIDGALAKMIRPGQLESSMLHPEDGAKAWNDSFDNANWDNDSWQDWNNG